MKTNIALTVALLMSMPFACDKGDDGSDDIEPREAEASWHASNQALASGHHKFDAEVRRGEDGEVRVDCEDGGILVLSGTMNENDDFQLDATYDGCIQDGVIIDGDLTFIASLDVDIDLDTTDDDEDGDEDHAAARLLLDYQGRLEYDGDVEGTCVVDAQLHAQAVAFDDFAGAGVTAEGTICGHDASIVLGVQAHDDDDDNDERA
jgi:hypothetical protein